MRTTIGISAGDPAGIGLEVTLKALPSVLDSARWVLFADPPTFERNYGSFGKGLPYRRITQWDDIAGGPGLFLMDAPGARGVIPWGEVRSDAGERAIAYLEAASAAALDGRIDAIVTAPVSKASIGPPFAGQTEFLAGRARVPEFAMAFFAPTFKVVLATVHMPLHQALARISTERYVQLIQFVSREFQRFGFSNLRIAVAGVNPHAGEGGMFGREVIDLLTPAVEQCARMGISVSGPHSADSLYYRDAASNMVTVAATTITNSSSLFPTNTHLIDFQMLVPTVRTKQA